MVASGTAMTALSAEYPSHGLTSGCPSLRKNRARDEANRATLSSQGWNCLTVWECELKDRDALKLRLARFLGRDDAID